MPIASRFGLFVGLSIAQLVAGCSGDPGALDASPEVTFLESEIVAAPSPFAFHSIAPCLSESDYVRAGAVFVQGGGCSPRCVRLASGGTVAFVGALPTQPVEPRAGGSVDSPITSSNPGGVAEFEFPDYGYFPFRCGSGPEATGVVWSTFW